MAERARPMVTRGSNPDSPVTSHGLTQEPQERSRANWASEFGALSRQDKFCHVLGGLALVPSGKVWVVNAP